MKNTKTCPKCNSKEIAVYEGGPRMSGGGCFLTNGLSFFTISVNHYVCKKCGYCEEWVSDEDLKEIK